MAMSRLQRWQALTITLLFLGYAGYYACRSNLSVCMPLISAELVQGGMSPDEARTRLGTIVSFGVLLYAFGKFFFGGVADRIGGRNNFLLGMLGSIACTIAFALGGALPVFSAAWAMNRFVQSAGWVGIVAVGTRWFVFNLRHMHWHYQLKLPRRRRRGAHVDGVAD